jgi:hypothetical protein
MTTTSSRVHDLFFSVLRSDRFKLLPSVHFRMAYACGWSLGYVALVWRVCIFFSFRRRYVCVAYLYVWRWFSAFWRFFFFFFRRFGFFFHTFFFCHWV